MINKIKKLNLLFLCFSFILCLVNIPANASASSFIQYDQTVRDTGILKTIQDLTTSTEENTMSLSWKSPYSDYDVLIERAVGNENNYVKLASFNITDSTYTYTDYNAETGIPYYYRIKITSYYEEIEAPSDSENIDDDYEYDYSKHKFIRRVKHTGKSEYVFSNRVIISLAAPEIEKIESADNRSVKLYWKDVDGADGYKIYRCTGLHGEYKLIKTMKATSYLSNSFYDGYYGYHIYTDANLSLGTIYYYKICAFKKVGNNRYNNDFSKEKKATTSINNTKVTGATSSAEGCNTIKWKRVNDCNGYIIYYKKKAKSKYIKLATIKGKNKTTYTHKKLVNGQRYYYKVVPYKNFKGQKITSTSNVYEKYCDYYAHQNESYYDKCQRIFKTNKRLEYDAEAEALKHMKTITIKVWDINDAGKWYTRYFDLTVHENIAPTVQKMFSELYKAKNPTPIHDIGCFSFRGGEHSIGCAIDINPEENCMMTNGVVESGSFWDPSKSVYSIPLNGDLVKIFKKYGFSRGFWRNRKDYMHFSYFGT